MLNSILAVLLLSPAAQAASLRDHGLILPFADAGKTTVAGGRLVALRRLWAIANTANCKA